MLANSFRNNHSPAAPMGKPSASYRADIWRLGRLAAQVFPAWICRPASSIAAWAYCQLRPRRQEIVVKNLLPALNGNHLAAQRTSRALFSNFALKLIDLWRYENGVSIDNWISELSGWELVQNARIRKTGILLITPHLGNWELGAPFLIKRGINLLVLTQPEPGNLTTYRQASRANWGIETLVIGNNDFGFVEVINRLQNGAAVALLIDRPHSAKTITTQLFGRPFQASVAPAELARATGCTILPVYVIKKATAYAAHALPPIEYDRLKLRDREYRRQFTQKIVHTFEPIIVQYLDQWYHFVPVWGLAKDQESLAGTNSTVLENQLLNYSSK